MTLGDTTRASTIWGPMTPLLPILVALTVQFWAVGCGGQMGARAASETPADIERAVMRLGEAKVFFAHQSVGGNLVDGILSVAQAKGPGHLKVIETAVAPEAGGGFFAHAKLGNNGDPKGKTDAFVLALETGLGRQVDIALQKYCFADFDDGTNAKELFGYYQKGIDRLHKDFPHLKIVHVTAPLMVVQSGPRAVVKKLLGRTPDHYRGNMVREEFNEQMRARYGGRELVFDLALLESSRPGEPREGLSFGQATVYALLPDYSSDGAHLNESAQRRIGAELISYLAGVVERRGASQRPGEIVPR